MRFPGKPLALIAGKPMIQWVYGRVRKAQGFDEVIVATDSQEIAAVVAGFGGRVEMTRPDHPSGTDRVWEVAEKMPEATYIFNVQGDEPLIDPLYLEEACAVLQNHHGSIDIITLKAPIRDVGEFEDPHIVKVVTTQDGKALYFSRSPIPYGRDAVQSENVQAQSFRHIGVYGFTRDALQKFISLPISPLETLEKLEQLRALEAGMYIHALTVPQAPIGVDTPEDLQRIQPMFAQSEEMECPL